MIVLHQFESSPFCDKVRRALHYKGRPYEVHEVPPISGLVELGKLNPARQVPVIEHQGKTLSDSSRILRYLEELTPDPRMVPEDPRERALGDLLEDWADESLYFYEVYFRFAMPENAEHWADVATRSESGVARALGKRAIQTAFRASLQGQGLGRLPAEKVIASLTRHVESIDALVSDREWLVAPHLSIADIAVYAQLACIADTGEGQTLLADRPRVLEWMERVNGATSAT